MDRLLESWTINKSPRQREAEKSFAGQVLQCQHDCSWKFQSQHWGGNYLIQTFPAVIMVWLLVRFLNTLRVSNGSRLWANRSVDQREILPWRAYSRCGDDRKIGDGSLARKFPPGLWISGTSRRSCGVAVPIIREMHLSHWIFPIKR